MWFYIFRLYVSPVTFSQYYQILYGLLSVLSLAWILGIFPPLDAFFPWIMEQILTRFLGGSPVATDLRLCLKSLML